MKTVEFLECDKLEWGAGPWVTEPDRVEWQNEETGYWCLANRNWRITGSWCGYVAVPKDHPYFGKIDREHTSSSSKLALKQWHDKLMAAGDDFSKIADDDTFSNVLEQHPDFDKRLYELNVHGGVTYTGDNEPPTKKAWEKWRKYMLGCKDSIEQYPDGDAAHDWRDLGKFIDDFDGWVENCMERYVHLPLTEPVTFIGFDCGHYMDYMPRLESFMNKIMPGREKPDGSKYGIVDTYKDLLYVQSECRSLAKQLKALEVATV